MKDQDRYVMELRENYTPHERTKLDELKALDKRVKTPAAVFAYIFGVAAALILGTGMCLALQIIGVPLMSPTVQMSVGIPIGCAGIAMAVANYFIYKAILSSRKKKYGARIVALGNEILNKKDR